jgi:hypothetical protein
MQVKTCPITVKATTTGDTTDEGIVEAIVAAYNVDSVGDQIIPGAFAKSLERHKSAGNRLPFVWSHKSDDLDSYIGEVIEAEERPEGLWVKAKLDMDDRSGAKAYRMLKGRRVSQFSFAYTETDARPAGKSALPGAVKELHELDIHECGPTMVGANPNTALLGVKSGVCSACGQKTAPPVAEAPAPEAPVEAANSGAEAPNSTPPAAVDDALTARIADMVRAAVTDALRDRPEASTTPATDTADTEATPDEPATVPPAAQQPASDREPASTGTADGRLRTELDLLEIELDEHTI